ncbi:MAG TPA: glycosyltransferase family 2 protein [Patescibacteria group bacterium]|nr:glycosyltransferase family 2 protein [Patescibacteria group bacterium]
MRSRLRVSIVIPAYNEERHLVACLDAIAAQSTPVLEAIVVDNNSTDKTAEIALRYPFVRVVHERRQGRVFARNAGFNAARGDIIGRIDADIRLPSNWVDYIENFYADETNRRQAWSGRGYFYNVRMPHLVSWAYALLAFRLNILLIGHTTLWGSNMAITKAQWQQVHGTVHLRNDIHEDLDLTIHLHDAGFGITYDRNITTNAHMRRVRTNRDELWEYLQWWPRTLRLHHKWTWPICWFFGAFLLYGATYVLVLAEWLARRTGKQPLPD